MGFFSDRDLERQNNPERCREAEILTAVDVLLERAAQHPIIEHRVRLEHAREIIAKVRREMPGD